MYSVDYAQKIIDLLVPDKRKPRNIAYNQALASGVSDNHDWIFSLWKEAQYISDWTAGSYVRNDSVKYGKSIFVAIKDTSAEPTYSADWLLVSENFLGADFRLKIRNEKILFEYAINTWFGTTFRQPAAGNSDIHFTTNIIQIDAYIVGASEDESSKTFADMSSEFIVNSHTFGTQYNMSVNVPLVFFNTLGISDSIRESIIRNFVNRHIAAGIIYNVITY